MNAKKRCSTMAEYTADGDMPDILFWVGCAGSFDERAKGVTRAVVYILQAAGIRFAILGDEESCTGDPARRAGNDFLFQMQAHQNIKLLNQYGVKKILTACPHCFNTLKNEYPQLGGQYEVTHHAEFIQQLIDEGKIKPASGKAYKGKLTYHDPCYLGRINGIYEAPRQTLQIALGVPIVEMKRRKERGFCCGGGGAQMFKESEPGKKDIAAERVDEALATQADTIAVGCPYCRIMLADGVKNKEQHNSPQVKDLAEIVAEGIGFNQ